ncbi:uncharacterized protein LOC124249349 [Equus quagga]|uniref:uncharacterized protein LOC124249349 n=1 Tax=Equus quagga TaxID=89248 RepID=UPI001EE26292|nr:uncharacterized protein LOC124249349 [Equus quagga]
MPGPAWGSGRRQRTTGARGSPCLQTPPMPPGKERNAFHCHILVELVLSPQDSSPAAQEWTLLLEKALTPGLTQPRRNQHPPTCQELSLKAVPAAVLCLLERREGRQPSPGAAGQVLPPGAPVASREAPKPLLQLGLPPWALCSGRSAAGPRHLVRRPRWARAGSSLPPLGHLIPSCENMAQVTACDFRGEVVRGTVAASLRLSELPCCEDAQAALGEAHVSGNWGLQPGATVLAAAPPAPG